MRGWGWGWGGRQRSALSTCGQGEGEELTQGGWEMKDPVASNYTSVLLQVVDRIATNTNLFK